jgi:hypothetical protein
MIDEQILDAALDQLRALRRPKNWMTARAITKRLRKHPHLGDLTQPQLTEILTAEAARDFCRHRLLLLSGRKINF